MFALTQKRLSVDFGELMSFCKHFQLRDWPLKHFQADEKWLYNSKITKSDGEPVFNGQKHDKLIFAKK